MGAQQSHYEGPPEVLNALDIASVVKYMKSKRCRKVCVMLGAGVSTSAGIPDFRSPETGLYANLARLNLPYPEAVFEINYFRESPTAFYTLARELLPGRFRPTPTHSFVRLLADHGLLDTCFTQNIDTLERRAGVPPARIVEAHGSFAAQHCIECHAPFDGARMRACLQTGDIAHCAACDGLVKPDIVFFGESLPPLFHKRVPRLREADLLFVIGTSLTVQPFAALAGLVPEHCPRVLVNLDAVGDFGSRADDVVLLGRCDEVVRELCVALGWTEELEKAWAETEGSVEDFETQDRVEAQEGGEESKVQLEKELDEITNRMAQVLGEKDTDELEEGSSEGEYKDDSEYDEEAEADLPPTVTVSEEITIVEVNTDISTVPDPGDSAKEKL